MDTHIADLVDAAIDPVLVAEQWLAEFGHLVHVGSPAALAELFIEDPYWRDLLACQWDYRSLKGREQVCEHLVGEAAVAGLHGFAP